MDTSPGLSPQEGAQEPPAEPTVPSDARPASQPAITIRDHAQTVEAALAANTRAEATLGALYQAIQQVTQGVSGAREANEQLGEELSRVREMLAMENEQRLVYENQVALLQQQLADLRTDRGFLVEEQDAFLAGLLDEHAQAMGELSNERDEAYARIEALMRQLQETAPPAARARRTDPGLGETPMMPSIRPMAASDRDQNVEKLLAERDRSREVVRRLQQQRDDAQQALAQVTKERDRYLSELSRIAPGRVAPRLLVSPEDARRTQPAVPHLTTRATDPSPADGDTMGEPIGERMTAPPAPTLAEAIALSRPSPPAGMASVSLDAKPPLKRKPDPTREPLGSYSLRGEDPDKGDPSKGPSSA